MSTETERSTRAAAAYDLRDGAREILEAMDDGVLERLDSRAFGAGSEATVDVRTEDLCELIDAFKSMRDAALSAPRRTSSPASTPTNA